MDKPHLLLLLLIVQFEVNEGQIFLGCYKERPSQQSKQIGGFASADACVNECKARFYKYAMIKPGGDCTCHNYLGEAVNASAPCEAAEGALADAYATGSAAAGPPEQVAVGAVSDRSVAIAWRAPQSHTDILYYQVTARVLATFASYVPSGQEYQYSNDTLRAVLLVLPASKYNISIAAVSREGPGAPVSRVVETKLGDFEYLPEPPKIINNFGAKMEIKISEVVNHNGPVSAYLVVVVEKDMRQFFQEQMLKSYAEARSDETSYYITAELMPKDILKNFMVGDGGYYGQYYNAPLQSGRNYNVMVGVVSRFNGETKKAFSTVENSPKMLVITPELEGGDSPVLIVALSIAIGIMSCLLVAGIIGFLILKSRVTNRRQRLSDNQELTLQGPMIEVENNGYIPEEEPSKANHYRNLKQVLRAISYNQIKIDGKSTLGIGRFGRVNSGAINDNNTLIPVAIYSISDKKLAQEDRKNMLMDLDLLLKAGRNENIIALVGTCETPQVLLVALEYVSMNLKDLLLGSRDSIDGRFSNMSEAVALQLAAGVCAGMAQLEARKIVHRQLCARNILVAGGFVPKISGFGLAQYYSNNHLPDYTRWTALEVFKGQGFNAKSDVWAFACLLWEICVLGGTPYGNFSNNEIPERIVKGLRLQQLGYLSDEFYQIMLNCWQIDMDERPTFRDLVGALEGLKENNLIPYLSFNLYSNFQYEQFYPDMEIAVRPVF